MKKDSAKQNISTTIMDSARECRQWMDLLRMIAHRNQLCWDNEIVEAQPVSAGKLGVEFIVTVGEARMRFIYIDK